MNINIGSLKHNTILYINIDEKCDDTSPTFKNFFKHCLVTNNIKDSKNIIEKLSTKLDVILIEATKLHKEEIEVLEFIKSINKKVPIVFITNLITNEILIQSRDYSIDSFLLRPFKVQDLGKLCVVQIANNTKILKTRDTLKVLSKQVHSLKDENKELIKQKLDKNNLLKFYIEFQENYLQLVKIDKKGIIKFVSEELTKELKLNLLEKNFIQLFQDSSSIQNAIISSMKDRKINTIKKTVLKDKANKEWTLNILPSLEEEKELYSFNIFFYMTK